MLLQGKIALVTGAGSGIGAETARRLAVEGASVTVADIADANGEKVVEEIRAAGGTAGFFHADIASPTGAQELVTHVVATYGRLDVAVNNAGLAEKPGLMHLLDPADWARTIAVDLTGTWLCMRAELAHFVERGAGGAIVNIASGAGEKATPGLTAYSAAKHGVEGFSESLRRELQLLGIDVILINPGSVATAIWDKAENITFDHLAGTVWQQPFKKFTAWMIENGRKGLTSEHVGRVIAKALTVAKPRTRYLVVQGKFLNATLPTLLPSRLVDRMMGKQLGLLPPKAG